MTNAAYDNLYITNAAYMTNHYITNTFYDKPLYDKHCI